MTRYNPVSTYRLQFNKEFSLPDAEKIIQYLDKTGIKTIYASPVFQAVRGSMHGYDVTNPLQLNVELGRENDFDRLVEKLHARGMGWLQDIVPNHMAFSPQNPWIADLLEKGEESDYLEFFDIQMNHHELKLQGKLMLPFFGKPLEQLVNDQELSIRFDKSGFWLKYFENEYPISKNAYPVLLSPGGDTDIPAGIHEFLFGMEKWSWEKSKQNLHALFLENPDVTHHINYCLSTVNSNSEQMKAVLDQLFYLPTYWKETERMINYRRFFTINGLICLNTQNENVFKTIHELIQKWVKEQRLDGIRVDHIDGLFNPSEYLHRLRGLSGERTHITVEKILEKDERIPDHWPVDGTTGYDFLGFVNNLLTHPEKGPVFYAYYNNWIKKTDQYRDVFYKKNRFILYNRFKGELDNLTRECMSIASVGEAEMNEQEVRDGLGEFLVFCPVYKIYQAPSGFSDIEKQQVNAIIDSAVRANEPFKNSLVVLRNLFLLTEINRDEEIKQIDTFFRHCMQFTGPLMAKGIEDTAFYSYNPFIGHNEVGDSPGYFGIHTETFHEFMKARQQKTPLSLNATSTHDTKRGEDARARLNVLSDIPEKWMAATQAWRKTNRLDKFFDEEKEIPTANDEYFIYQVLVAHLPMDGKLSQPFIERLQEYLVKALREAKVNSSWSDPDEQYEKNTLRFVSRILDDSSDFPALFLAFMEDVIPHGIVNSLTQLILKNTCPGVPDTYQGCERWNLSFVDPDNRRPVDYQGLADDLDKMIRSDQSDTSGFVKKLWRRSENGLIKQWLTFLTLSERKMHKNLFLKGSYVPVEVEGKYRKHLIAFCRHFEDDDLLVVLPLNTAALPAKCKWEDTRLLLPDIKLQQWENILSKDVYANTNLLEVQAIFKDVPFGFLRGTADQV